MKRSSSPDEAWIGGVLLSPLPPPRMASADTAVMVLSVAIASFLFYVSAPAHWKERIGLGSGGGGYNV